MAPRSSALADALKLPPPDVGATCMWLGQSGFLLRFAGESVVIDPFLSESPQRLVPPMAETADFASVDLIVGTHDHIDHIDRAAWRRIGQETQRCRFAVPSLLLPKLAEDLGLGIERFIGLDSGRSLAHGMLRMTGIPAAHESFDRDPATGRFPYLGVVVEGNGAAIYHAGDTCVYSGLGERLLSWTALDLVILPINGRDAARFRRGIRGNMSYQEAADLAGFLRPRLTVPCHWDMFAGNGGDPEEFADYMEAKYPDLAVRIPEHGEIFRVGDLA